MSTFSVTGFCSVLAEVAAAARVFRTLLVLDCRAQHGLRRLSAVTLNRALEDETLTNNELFKLSSSTSRLSELILCDTSDTANTK